MFRLLYESLIINEKLEPWEIALIPWDTETFGFGVSALNPRYDEIYSVEVISLENALKNYSKGKRVRVVTASIPSQKSTTSLLLQQVGFRFIGLSLQISYENLDDIPAQLTPELSLVPAVCDEIGILADMARVSFRHGRYHLDPCFPASLADQRYKDWVNRAFNSDNPQQILTAKVDGTICGFSVVENKGSMGYMHLHAIDSKWQGKKLGHEMILQSLRYLYKVGAKTVGTKISASNLRAVNMHSRLNGRFIAAEYLLHWHRQER